MNTEEKIKKQLNDNSIILYMKGIPEAPECGFSAKAVAALSATGIPYAYVNVLRSPFIREKLPKISHWPTYPQLFIAGQLVGGADIIEAMAEEGSLLAALQEAGPTGADTGVSNAEIEKLIKQGYPDAKVYIDGVGCDLTVAVISDKFSGQSLVLQQQGVMGTLAGPLGNGRLHAVTIKSYTFGQWREKQAETSEDKGLLQIQA